MSGDVIPRTGSGSANCIAARKDSNSVSLRPSRSKEIETDHVPLDGIVRCPDAAYLNSELIVSGDPIAFAGRRSANYIVSNTGNCDAVAVVSEIIDF